MLQINNKGLRETKYSISDEAKLGAVFGIGNGYFGVRGSLEEFGDVFIQGTYIRGVFDQIVEIPLTFSDNLYMKQYYFDAQKLKEFEHEDSCINICDPLTIRFYVDGKLFLPWEGKVVKWLRYIDSKTGGLVRKVTWDDGKGNLTEFSFVRYCSFKNNHLILQEAKAKKLNHKLPIKVLMGVDTLVKTNGQHKSVLKKVINVEGHVEANFYMGDKYNHRVALSSYNEVNGAKFVSLCDEDKVYSSIYDATENEVTVRKVISMYASVDPVNDYVKAVEDAKTSYDIALKEHLAVYKKAYKQVKIDIKGNDEINALVDYANYQTLIGFDRYDSVHSLSAKNLTAEKYNQFVWWDAEIFQLPFVIANFPNAAKSCLEYRYRCLEEAKKIAANDGYKGAKFAFCSSVKGDENVWIYARHPFLQIHISSDVAYGVYNYYRQTLDKEFMLSKGLEMMKEVVKYFLSRSTLENGYYHLKNVTGTDEHHPYVNDDAYTNYQVKFIARKTLELSNELNYKLSEEEVEACKKLQDKMYLPLPDKRGIIPQFEGYFNLKSYLPLDGNGAATGFQMKASGLYHLSQIIKQPDVLNLYTYLDCDMDQKIYKANWKFYYKMCEASSSLTYPVHTISAIDFHDNETFLANLKSSLTIDINDLHNCAYQGVHAGCLAGGWYAIYRGVFGILPRENELVVDPKFDMPFESVEMNIVYHGQVYNLCLSSKKLVITTKGNKPITVSYKGKHMQLNNCLTIVH